MKYYREEAVDAWLYIIETFSLDSDNALKDEAFRQFVLNLLHYYPDESDLVMERLDKHIKKTRKDKR
jgi:hypothetical protein